MKNFERNCIIALNKPTGMSSSLAVSIVKRTIHPNKIGHLGTLDPLGTGMLLLAVNKATKLFDEYLKKRKVYRAIFKFGIETDTFDSEGNVTNLKDCNISYNQVTSATSKFLGEQNQMPPMFSAKKIGGKKAYELAREGKVVELKPRLVNIYRFECLKQVCFNTFLFEIECSAGTYIRSLCRDIAKELSTYGTMVSIIRTKCGVFTVGDMVTIDQIKEGDFKFYDIDEQGGKLE